MRTEPERSLHSSSVSAALCGDNGLRVEPCGDHKLPHWLEVALEAVCHVSCASA